MTTIQYHSNPVRVIEARDCPPLSKIDADTQIQIGAIEEFVFCGGNGDPNAFRTIDWDFGDDTPIISTEYAPETTALSHAYHQGGIFELSVVVMNAQLESYRYQLDLAVADCGGYRFQDGSQIFLTNTNPFAVSNQVFRNDLIVFTLCEAPSTYTLDGLRFYQWTWGDGSSAAPEPQGVVKSHRFTKTGTFQVRVRTHDEQDLSIEVEVVDRPDDGNGDGNDNNDECGGSSPVQFVSAPLGIVPVGSSLEIALCSSNPSVQQANAFRWSFGDNSPLITTSELNISHIYETGGQYEVDVDLLNIDGAVFESFEAANHVRAIQCQPEITESALIVSGVLEISEQVLFTACLNEEDQQQIEQALDANDQQAFYRWSFGDEATLQPDPAAIVQSHIYHSAGTFQVQLDIIMFDTVNEQEVLIQSLSTTVQIDDPSNTDNDDDGDITTAQVIGIVGSVLVGLVMSFVALFLGYRFWRNHKESQHYSSLTPTTQPPPRSNPVQKRSGENTGGDYLLMQSDESDQSDQSFDTPL